MGALFFLVWLPHLAGGETQPPPEVEFNRQVRPILSAKCFRCHGPDRAKRRTDLRLDLRDAALAPGTERPALVPGQPQESEVYRRITASKERERMPPVRSGLKLTAQEIDILRRWIEQGAPYQPHWSLLAPRSPPLPQVRPSGWPKNPLDLFVLARLEQEGLRPSPEASRTTWLRRVSLDLTGPQQAPA